MANNGDVFSLLEDCVKIINDNTAQPENFLSLQDEVAADFTSLTKTLYDLHKSQEPAGCKSSPLAQLVVDDFDEEQIWQELELQNEAVLKHFKNAIDGALADQTLTLLSEEEEDEEEEEEEVEEDEGEEEVTYDEKAIKPPPRLKKKNALEAEDRSEGDSEGDSDLNFDVDALEKREKQKKGNARTGSKTKLIPSEVDDKFFKLSEMESFLDEMDKREGKEDEDEDDVDYFQDLPSDEDSDLDLEQIMSSKKKQTEKSSRNLKYKDFFDAVDREPAKGDEQSDGEGESQEEDYEEMDDEDDDYDGEEEGDDEDEQGSGSKTHCKKVTFNLSGDEESEGEDMEEIFGGKAPQNTENSELKSSFEKRQEKMLQKISDLEKAALEKKSWQLSGEVTAQTRPENSMLEEDVEFEQASRTAPAVTEETTLQLEDIIKQRIKDQAFDDVVRKEKPKEEVFEYKKRLTLDHEKSKQSLAEIYEQEYIKQTQQNTEEEENPAHVEIQKLMDQLFLKLDALSNFHFTPKPPVPEVKVVSNLPSITMEEVAPVSTSDATLLAPEEIKEKNKAGDILGDTEKTATDKKRERRHKKKVKHLKIKEKEKRQKLKEASRAGENRKVSKAEVTENLKKLTKGGKATILKDEGKDKSLRSSQAFFSQLQDQVKSQIKSAKDQSSKKKKQKAFSATKLKL
ncbi:U3 small nucleolar ribonucleoprotein protein MPP10 [Kryptolebias marmoratus]|uniref:U3 small nucleolar ribonucleoprotein protein MPP10 n=1 Tax=Kryptolebias marmoratus TaxID=37003 RepID=A0A3Q2ZHH2_KRYMA|nr:U3 small nucleolar ribonucleoprotein protein MPP10 [Kryptolebias marmoratus]